MRFVYVLEDEPKFMKEITEALLLVDPEVQVRQFLSLEHFANWLKVLMSEGTAAIKKGGSVPDGFKFAEVTESDEAILQVLISKVEFLGARQLGLMKKTRDLFVRQKVCTVEDPTAFVLTAFEDPNFKIADLKDRILSNIIMKPFDRLILQQDLTFALDGRHPPSKHAVAPYKTSALIEVVKTVDMDVLSSIGFLTRSNRELPVGAIAKYYGQVFVSERHRSMIAKMVDCFADPKRPGEFLATFSFFGADQTQISSIRKKVIETKTKRTQSPLSIHPSGQAKFCRILVIEERTEVAQAIESMIKRKIKGAAIFHYDSLKDFLIEVDPKLAQDGGVKEKAFGDAVSVELEIDARGVLVQGPAKELKYHNQALTKGFNLGNLVKQNDQKTIFINYFGNPQGTQFFFFKSGERSNLIKFSLKEKRIFIVEEASAAELDQYSKNQSQVLKGWDFLFISNRSGDLERLSLWKDVVDRVRKGGAEGKFRNFLVAAREYSDQEERELATFYDDLFFVPVERVYILQKMIMFMPELGILEDPIEIFSMEHHEQIKSARPAQIEELSEAGLVMKYDRAMSIGSFREFVLWQPYEINAPEINATCNFVEEGATKGEWKLHFVFFAMKDTLLKAIRSWILDNYVASKDKG